MLITFHPGLKRTKKEKEKKTLHIISITATNFFFLLQLLIRPQSNAHFPGSQAHWVQWGLLLSKQAWGCAISRCKNYHLGGSEWLLIQRHLPLLFVALDIFAPFSRYPFHKNAYFNQQRAIDKLMQFIHTAPTGAIAGILHTKQQEMHCVKSWNKRKRYFKLFSFFSGRLKTPKHFFFLTVPLH